MDIELIFKYILGSAGTLALLVFAVQWLNKDRDRINAALLEERNQRLKVLEDATSRCAQDRLQLHTQIGGLQTEVRTLYKWIIERAAHLGAPAIIHPAQIVTEHTETHTQQDSATTTLTP